MLFQRATMTAAVLLASALGAQADSHVNADTVVATVGDTEITLGHMIVLKARLPEQYQSLPNDVLFDGILDQLVQQSLLAETQETLSIGSRKSLENEERALLSSEAVRGIANEVTSEEAVQAAYDADYAGNPEFARFNAHHILFLIDPVPGADETQEAFDARDAEQRARAEEVIADLAAGEDFATIAQERSEGPSASAGGALGWFESGRMVPEFDAAVKDMSAGDISVEPVRTQFGWHVIRLNEVQYPELDAVRPQIVETIQRAAIDARLTELRDSVEVTTSTDEIDPTLLDDLSLLGE
ncbi:peptidylprolyl isomerase [Kangsaoukella pontilimi]|nr:peptidylprolyl isomerase [Kangsaoukella pontilimi]